MPLLASQQERKLPPLSDPVDLRADDGGESGREEIQEFLWKLRRVWWDPASATAVEVMSCHSCFSTDEERASLSATSNGHLMGGGEWNIMERRKGRGTSFRQMIISSS